MRLLAGTTGPGSADRPDAVTVDGRTLSSEALLGAALAVAADVHGAATVAVDATPSLETVVAVVGGLLAGAAVVPVPSDAGPAERSHILDDSGASVVLDTVDVTRRSSISLPTPAPESPALIMYTSGTTGAPKGVVHTHASLEAGVDAVADAWDWTPDDRLVHGLPLFHVHGLVLGVLGALRAGSPLVHTRKPQPERYAAAGGTLYFGVPTVWSRICAQPAAARALSRARLLVSGSAALPVPVFERLRALTGHTPVERYGMTETLITISSRFDGARFPGDVGVPVRGVETRVEASDGDIGELLVRGPMLLRRYVHQPADLVDGWFRTGDIARKTPDGRHRIVGRASTDLIKSGGYRIGAGEVEDALLAHPAVREAAVIGTPHADLGEAVTAYVVVSPGAALGADDLVDFVARQLSVHKRPRVVHLVEALPRNAMGKVQKKRLGGPML
ncbi:AMP-binding protein [Dactylosporangium sp. NPDC006015]|uniref:AMP-binding protein n=1 Tax=Dactylosporangium sp. NPDC006015 TaxID=3154576 RepID=UPI0033A276AA